LNCLACREREQLHRSNRLAACGNPGTNEPAGGKLEDEGLKIKNNFDGIGGESHTGFV
jgi:hypothetical protein